MSNALGKIIDKNVPVEMRRATKYFLSENATKDDIMVRDMVECGFGYDYMSKVTGLSKGQIGYRLKMLGMSPKDWRNGQSILAQKVTNLISEDSKRYFETMVSNIRRYLKEG